MLTWDVSRDQDGVVRLRLKGAITEAVTFDDLARELEAAGPHVVLIGDGVRYINSVGVKRLWRFLASLAERGRVDLERCSPSLCAQLNLVPALTACVRVVSIIAPLECTECIAETHILLDMPATGGTPDVPAYPCPVCGAVMELAELEQLYFAFATDGA